MSTLKDVAEMAGVSRTTVSRFVNNSGYVSREVEKRIKDAIETLDFRPNRIAQTLNTNNSGNIALVVSDVSNPLTALYLKGVEAVTYNKGYNLIICNTNFDILKEISYIKILIDKQVDGLVLAPATRRTDHIQELIKRGIPLVFITRRVPGISADYAGFANEDGSYRVVDHLISTGHKRVGIICRYYDIDNSTGRLRGYIEALKANNIEYDSEIVYTGGGYEKDGFEGASKFLSLKNPPTAIYTAVGIQAAGVIRYCNANRIKIPKDIALASFESIGGLDELIVPKITSNIMPVFELGKIAAEMLFSRLEGDATKPFREVKLNGDFIVAESTVGI